MGSPGISKHEQLDLLRATTLFKRIDENALQSVLSVARLLKFGKDAFIFMEGDEARIIYVLARGKVKLTQVTQDGQQVIMGYIVPGREFGLLAALENKTYPVSAQAVGSCQAFGWNQETFNALINTVPQIAVNGLGIFAKRIEGFQNRVRELATQRVERRIARTLLRLAQQTGKKTVSGVLIDMPISRQDLAEMNGTTVYTVSRTLKNWENQGLIQSKREQIHIIFPHGLVRIAEDLPISKADLELQDE